MVIRFNKKLKQLIKATSKEVAYVLDVDKVTLTVVIEDNSDKKTICFETRYDNVYALLETYELDLSLILEDFLTDSRVEWHRRS